jgi:hypothetical protein
LLYAWFTLFFSDYQHLRSEWFYRGIQIEPDDEMQLRQSKPQSRFHVDRQKSGFDVNDAEPKCLKQLTQTSFSKYLEMGIVIKIGFIAVSEIWLEHNKFAVLFQNASQFRKQLQEIFPCQMLKQVACKNDIEVVVTEVFQIETGLVMNDDILRSILGKFAEDINSVLFPAMDIVYEVAISGTEIKYPGISRYMSLLKEAAYLLPYRIAP